MENTKKRKKKKNQVLAVLILIMLLIIAASMLWIVHKGRADNAAREAEVEETEETQETESGMGAAQEEAIAQQEAEDEAVASHVYSNRGKAGSEEHSFKAYDEAIEAGSRYIGLDIVVSADKVLYVSSEDNAMAMTGYNGAFEYMSSETIDGLETEAGNKILRLSEVFDKYGDSVNYVIELKPNSDACVEAFEDLVDEYGLSGVITVGSRFSDILKTLEDKYPDMPKLFVCWNQGDFDRAVDQKHIDIISVRAEVETGILTESNCEAAHAFSKKFSAWTLDTEDDIKKAIDMGVDTYFTNDTSLALSIEKDYGLKTRSAQDKQ